MLLIQGTHTPGLTYGLHDKARAMIYVCLVCKSVVQKKPANIESQSRGHLPTSPCRNAHDILACMFSSLCVLSSYNGKHCLYVIFTIPMQRYTKTSIITIISNLFNIFNLTASQMILARHWQGVYQNG